MKPAAFEYHRPESLAEAIALLAQHGDELKPLAGGQSLMPMLAMRLARPAHIMDLERVPELRGIDETDGAIRIGAMVRQREVERNATLPPVVSAAVAHIGHFQIRNRGTVGGSLAHMDPAAEWPALALALGCTVTAESVRGRRAIAADSFAVGPLLTALAPDELLTEVSVPVADGGFGFAEVEHRSGDFALVGAIFQSGTVVVFAAGPRPQRLVRTEQLISAGGEPGRELISTAEAEIAATDDIHASAAYRRRVGAALVDEVVRQGRAAPGEHRTWS